jgi:predicted double-glycine peptidase
MPAASAIVDPAMQASNAARPAFFQGFGQAEVGMRRNSRAVKRPSVGARGARAFAEPGDPAARP